MGAPESGIDAAGPPRAEELLTFRTIKAPERARHENVLNYWLSIRGDKEFPPLHDLDPLEISDAGPSSILLELVGGGQDAEIRHLGETLKGDVAVERIIDAPNPSILCSIASKLPIVAISRDFLAYEDSFNHGDVSTRCWVTLLPLSSCGSWVDYVYAFVSVETTGGKAKNPVEPPEPPVDKAVVEEPEAIEVLADEAEAVEEASVVAEEPVEQVEAIIEPEAATPVVIEDAIEPAEASVEPESEPELEAEPEAAPPSAPGFSKLIEGIANLAGFYGQGIKVDPVIDVEPPSLGEADLAELEPFEPPIEIEEPTLADESAEIEPVEQPVADIKPEPQVQPQPQPAPAMEGSLNSKLSEVRARADEARQAQLRATAALHEGLSAAYDFALDAETSPEEYLRLVEAQGMKIQLRAPMAPVAKLAFEGVCDPTTIAQFEAVLAWALKEELPRGALLERIQEAGGIAELLGGVSRPS
jgi:hypothetical protein